MLASQFHKTLRFTVCVIIVAIGSMRALGAETIVNTTDSKQMKQWQNINKYIDKQSAKIGVSCHFVSFEDSAKFSQNLVSNTPIQSLLKQANTFNHRAQDSFVIMSVAKLPIALYAMHLVNINQLSLDTLLFIDSNDIKRDTHSPTVNGKTQPFSITLKQAIEASIQLSDNITTDLIIDAVGGIKNIETYYQQLGFKDLHVRSNYRNMDQDQLGANCSSPIEMNQLLLEFYFKHNTQGANPDFIYQLMASTPTGPNRIRGELPANTIVAHKTGTYFTDKKHVAINDIGIIRTQTGILFLTVFVNDFNMSAKHTEKAIAHISKMLFDHYNKSL